MLQYQTLPATPTLRTAAVMGRFGIDFETAPVVIAREFELSLPAPAVVAFTGESGSGKSTLMRHVAATLPDGVDLDAVELGTQPLIDRLGGSVDEAMRLLSRCGLAEPRLLLRRPGELSEGQRYRFRLAVAVDSLPNGSGWIMADEFTATLDRTLARVVARNVGRLAAARGIGVLLATTHRDVIADLSPEVHVRCRLDDEPDVIDRRGNGER